MLQNIKDKFFSRSTPPLKKNEDYYFSIGRIYGIFSVILLICAGVFALTSIIFGYRELTYENVYYFIKDFDTVIKSDSYDAVTVDYGVGNDRSYYSYRGGIVAAEKYSVSVYSATGRETAAFSNEYVSPVVKSSSKYMLIYDSDGEEFSVCNSFITLHSENIGQKIYSADINDVGDALIHTEASGYGSALYLYNVDFERAATYYFNDYITCSALSRDGSRIYVSTVSVDGGQYISKFKVYRRGETEAFQEHETCGEVPLDCGQLKGDEYYLITERGVRVFNEKGDLLKEYLISDDEHLIDFYKCENGIVVSFKSKDKYCLTYIPIRGDTLTLKLDSTPLSLSCIENCVYVLYDGAVAKYDITSGTYKLFDCAPGGEALLTTQNGKLLLCYSSRAVYVNF